MLLVLDEKPKRELAFHLWNHRGRPDWDEKADWQRAESMLREDQGLCDRLRETHDPVEQDWNLWAKVFLKPYLALEAATNPRGLAAQLQRIHPANDPREPKADCVVLLAVLDGSPEFSRMCYSEHRGNCVNPGTIIDQKDDCFYSLSRMVLEIYGGTVIDQGSRSLDRSHKQNPRAFQDGCAAVFTGKEPIKSAVASAIRLRTALADHNAENSLQWPQQLHARVVAGSTWLETVRLLPVTSRNEIALPTGSLGRLDSGSREICYSAGITSATPPAR